MCTIKSCNLTELDKKEDIDKKRWFRTKSCFHLLTNKKIVPGTQHMAYQLAICYMSGTFNCKYVKEVDIIAKKYFTIIYKYVKLKIVDNL